MNLPTDASIFGMLRARMDVLTTRQKTIAENVANATTPGYVPRDVEMDAFAKTLSRQSGPGVTSVSLATTQAGHIPAAGRPPGVSGLVRVSPDSETTLDGNAVVVEEQMLRMNQTRMDFDTALSLYQKALGFVRIASKSPGI